MSIATLQRGVERHMRDVVTVTHATAGPTDDAIDPNTLKPVPSSGETPTTVYAGKALFVPDAASMTSADGLEVEVGLHRFLLPAAASLPTPGDTITLNTAVDPAFALKSFTVDSCSGSSFNAARVVHARLLTAARPVHGS